MNLISTKAQIMIPIRRFFILCLLLGNVHHRCYGADMEFEKSESHVQNESSDTELNESKIFFPTREWQVIEPDAIIFAGLHYRINVATGLKEAKLMDESDGSEYYQLLQKWIQERTGGTLPTDIGGGFKIKQEVQVSKKLASDKEIPEKDRESNSIIDREKEKYGLTQVSTVDFEIPENSRISSSSDKNRKSFIEDLMKLDDSHASFDKKVYDLLKSTSELEDSNQGLSAEPPSKFRTYEQLKQELADLELLIDDEQHIMQGLIREHQSLTAESEIIKSVEDIEYLLHNIDNAQVFIDYGGLHKIVLPALNSSSAVVRAQACRLVTACVQNFPKGQIAAFEAGLLPSLLTILQSEQTGQVHSRTLSSFSGMVRHFPLAQTELMRTGLPVLRSLLRQPALVLKTKVTALLADLLLERMEDSDISERAQQLAAVGLEGALVDLDWCHHLTQNLRQTADAILGEGHQDLEGFMETLLHALHASVSLCPVELRSTLPTLQHLETTFRNEANAVTSLDKAELYQETANSILGLMSSFVAGSSGAKVEL